MAQLARIRMKVVLYFSIDFLRTTKVKDKPPENYNTVSVL